MRFQSGVQRKSFGAGCPLGPAANENFKVAVYIPVNIVERMRNSFHIGGKVAELRRSNSEPASESGAAK